MRGVKRLLFKVFQAVLFTQARMVRKRVSGPVIAIVGSVGKTSTKDAIGLIVRMAFGSQNCVVTPKSLNAEIGVPLTILGFTSLPIGLAWIMALVKAQLIALFGVAPQAMVIELGEENLGDIAQFGRLVRPTHVIITDVSEAHSAYLGGQPQVKAEILSVLNFLSEDGVVLVNADSDDLRALTVQPPQTKMSVRNHTRSDYFASNVKVTMDGTSAIIHHANRTQKVTVKRWGEHHLYAVLFMAAIADLLGIGPAKQLQAFKLLRPTVGRGVMLEGKKGSFILDDSYNAQPAAMRAALETLHQIPAKKRVAIIGDMRELKDPVPHHVAIGKLAHEVADYVIAVGPLSKNYRAHEWFPDAVSATEAALRQLGPGVIVLVKGSQNTIRLERVVKSLMAHPEQASQKLVRQEKFWQNIP